MSELLDEAPVEPVELELEELGVIVESVLEDVEPLAVPEALPDAVPLMLPLVVLVLEGCEAELEALVSVDSVLLRVAWRLQPAKPSVSAASAETRVIFS